MAVDALELRPRNAVGLFDAALRVCAGSTVPWALTLPSGALVVVALLELVGAVQQRRALASPVAFVTLAWATRAICQGAACHALETQLVGERPPSVRASLWAALRRAPALVTAAAWTLLLNATLWLFSLGIGALFFGAHAVAYAAMMRGQGSALRLYGTCSSLLGPTRHAAPWVRLLGASQVLLALNLHLVTALALALLNRLFGFDVTFAERFASLDNPTWVAGVVAVTFALFEPVRVATATLMLVDGRVRQEGLDLLAQLQQLPPRRPARPPTAAVISLALLALPWPAAAAPVEPAVLARVREVVQACELSQAFDLSPLERGVPDGEQSALSRFLSRVERRAFEDDDCEGAGADLRSGLRLLAEAHEDPAPGDDPQGAARAILGRPEFQATPPAPEREAAPPDGPGWLARLLRQLLEWLRTRDEGAPDRRDVELPAGGSGMAGANAVMVAALVLVGAVLAGVLVRSLRARKDAAVVDAAVPSEQPLAPDALGALARPPEGWTGLADTLAARGEYREAIRHLYLALLSRLHRDGAIDYDTTRSNWDYLATFQGPGPVKAGFRELTRRFDFAWYGNQGVDGDAYATFRERVTPLLSPPAGARHA